MRAKTSREWFDRVGGAEPPVSGIGAQSSIAASGNSKSAGSTPTISCGTPFSAIVRPTAAGSLPNRDCHNEWPRITTRCWPGVASSRRNGAAERGPHAQDVEEWRRHAGGGEADGFARAGQVGGDPDVRGHVLEHGVHPCPVDEVGGCHDVVEDAFRGPLLPHLHQAIRLVIRQRPEQQRVDGGEDRRVAADADGERQQRDDRHSRLLDEQPPCIPRVAKKRVHPPPPASELTTGHAPVFDDDRQPFAESFEAGVGDRVQKSETADPPAARVSASCCSNIRTMSAPNLRRTRAGNARRTTSR